MEFKATNLNPIIWKEYLTAQGGKLPHLPYGSKRYINI
jgi:hypothetical protein